MKRMQSFAFAPPIELEIDFAGTQNADFAELIFRAFHAAFRLGGAANVPL